MPEILFAKLSSQLSGSFDEIKYKKIIEANYLILEMQEKSISGFITKDTEKSSQVVTLFNKFNAISNFIKNDYIKTRRELSICTEHNKYNIHFG